MADPAFIVIVVLAVGFALVNGFNDAANAVAAAIGSRSISPKNAILLAAGFNFAGAMTGTAVAQTIGKGILVPGAISYLTVISGLASVVIWGATATFFGLPISLTHGFIAGLASAGVAVTGTGAVIWGVMQTILISVAIAPGLGFVGGFGLMLLVSWIFRHSRPNKMRIVFSRLQWLTTGFLAYSHGKNDGQMPVGIITMALVIQTGQAGLWDSIPIWVLVVSGASISLGTALGGWRVIKTVGMRVTVLDSARGFTSSLAAASVIEGASRLGIPVSTTHCSTAAIMGVGAAKRLSAVRWGTAKRIVLAWVLTLPICGGLGYLIATLAQRFTG